MERLGTLSIEIKNDFEVGRKFSIIT